MYGPSKDLENKPEQIIFALNHEFDVEIDLWYHNWQNSGVQWYLGHDKPEIPITEEWISQLPLDRVWIHAKDITTLAELTKIEWPIHYFFHESDATTLTSSRYLWTYPGKQLTDKSIMLLPEVTGMAHIETYARQVSGICSDYVVEIFSKLSRYGHNLS